MLYSWITHITNLFLLTDMFTFNMITGTLRLKSVISVFVFCVFPLLFMSLFSFYWHLYVTWVFLEFYFDLSLVFLFLSFTEKVAVLGITLYMHGFSQFTGGVILPVWIQCRNHISLYGTVPSLIYSMFCLKHFLYIHLEPHYIVLYMFILPSNIM